MRREKKRHGDPNTQLLFVSTCRHTYILAMVLEEVVVVVKKMTMFEKNKNVNVYCMIHTHYRRTQISITDKRFTRENASVTLLMT